MLLVGRDWHRLDRTVADLKVRSPESEIYFEVVNFSDPPVIDATVKRWFDAQRVDLVLIAHGFLPPEGVTNNLTMCRKTLEINGISPVLYAESCAVEMKKVNHGKIALISSVAGDRGRRANYVYGAAKGLVSRYAEGLQHHLAGSRVKVILIKPGPTLTPMTEHLQAPSAELAPVDRVAKKIVDGINSNAAVVYAPSKWRMIMMIVRHIPAIIFNRLDI